VPALFSLLRALGMGGYCQQQSMRLWRLFADIPLPRIRYNASMTKTLTPPGKTTTKGFKVGRRAFAKISAVEGIHLSPEMAKDFGEFDRKGLSADQRRKAIARKYGAVRS
jgi:hypothetical protein